MTWLQPWRRARRCRPPAECQCPRRRLERKSSAREAKAQGAPAREGQPALLQRRASARGRETDETEPGCADEVACVSVGLGLAEETATLRGVLATAAGLPAVTREMCVLGA